MLKRLFLCLILLTVGMIPASFAQTPTTQGTEFWASFMRNGYNTNSGSYNHFTLIASAKRACTVTVTNPNTGWEDHFTVSNNGVSTYYVERNQGYNDQMGGKASKGLFITSSDTISLYIANEAENSYDAANVLPASALGSQYMIQSYKALGDQTSHYGDSRASFLVLATEDNTEVQITPSCLTYDNHPAGQPYPVTLNRGECYHVLNKNAGSTTNVDGDFSGTMVVSADDKPIAVFNGNSITSVPGGLSTGYDHIFEQAMPTDYWGKKFVVTSTRCPAYMGLQPDQIKVTALNDNTTVTRNGAELFTLDAGESNFFTMDLVSEPCAFLEADNPIAVFLYQHSHGDGSPAYGDPSMVWISPVEQTVFEVTFSTFAVQQVEVHYVNVVCYTENVSGMTLDGQDISSNFIPVPDAPEFSYTRYQVNHAAHTLRCPGGFIAHVYGIGQAEGYAYSVGSSAKILTKQLYVNDVLSTELPNGCLTTCPDESISFRVETNYEIDHVNWTFGDGSTDSGREVVHAYSDANDYEVMSVIYREIDNQVQPFDTLSVAIRVNPLHVLPPVSVITCDTVFHFHGKDYPVPFVDDVILQSDVGCDTICHLSVLAGASSSAEPLYDTACIDDGYLWFDTIRYESGTYVVIVEQPDGCDSLYLLHLTIGSPPDPDSTVRCLSSCTDYYWYNVHCTETRDYTLQFTTEEGCVYDSILRFTLVEVGTTYETREECDSYKWPINGVTYSDIGTNTYTENIIGENGCESTVILYLTLHKTPPFEEILGLDNVAVATTFWPGKYMYRLDDYEGLAAEDIHWELLGNTGWSLDTLTYGRDTCVITATSMGIDTLCVWTSVDSGCDKMRKKVINASGFAVDENGLGEIKVYPNPARDELYVEAEELERVIVYDLMGQRLREVGKSVDGRVQVKVGDLSSALYLVEIRTKKGNKTQLFSVIR